MLSHQGEEGRRVNGERRRRPTSTSAFGAGRRESHDASYFYARFSAPRLSKDEAVNPPAVVDRIFEGDARRMDEVAPASVALVVTSPPYFAGKEYERALGEGGVPATYFEYLKMLTEVFACCLEKLEPGGRIAVNVANLGRRPYRSLSADVIGILQDRLGMLLRGEIVWQKARGAGGSCAWGSFQSPANPVLRDLTERVVIASKGRFNRAIPRRERALRGLPSEASIFTDDFMEATTDLWEIPPESATRVGHPAPFPVELPLRLIELYSYRGDLVLDPFMGSGSAAVAALRAERHFVGYDIEPGYVDAATRRVEDERARLAALAGRDPAPPRVVLPAVPSVESPNGESFQSRAVREGRKAKEIARAVLEDCGFSHIVEDRRMRSGVEVDFVAQDRYGKAWYFDVSGAFTSTRAGLRRTDTLWKALGKAAVLSSELAPRPLVLLTTDLPTRGSAGETALRAARGTIYFDAVEMLSPQGQGRLRQYAAGGGHLHPIGELLSGTEQDER
jgi:site-specific DNA-methyltransferase (adenine-specific)